MHDTSPKSPTLLIELFDLATEEILNCDVSARLDNALQAVYLHLAQYADTVTPQVSLGTEGELDGIAFFGPNEKHLAFITAYYLEREVPECEFDGLRDIAALPLSELDNGLKSLFS
jgi:hypothetical protein